MHSDNRLHVRISIFNTTLLSSLLASSLTAGQHAAAAKVNTYGPRSVWHWALIGGFPRCTPARRQTSSKIVRHTSLGCFESLARCSLSHCEPFLPPFNDIHLAGPKAWVANGDRDLNPSTLPLPAWKWFHLCLCRLHSAMSPFLFCCVPLQKIMRNRPQPSYDNQNETL